MDAYGICSFEMKASLQSIVVVVVVVVVAALNVGVTLSSRPRCGTRRSRKDSASLTIRHRSARVDQSK